jgi:hypothetical protein
VATEVKAFPFEQIPEGRSVIDLAVVNQDVTIGVVYHRLVAQGREILNSEAAIP